MVRPRSLASELLSGGMSEVVCLGDAHLLLLAPPEEGVEVGGGGGG